ncbi:MAG: hypothetical protein OXG35_10645, partial [Acidobacteria bacterium]|nr:hypothetical protein [Acidobacteriota bacterium]
LKQVIVAYQNEIAMEETLDGALSRLFGSGAGAPAETTPPVETLIADAGPAPPVPDIPAAGPGRLVSQAGDHYRRALRAQRDGDWAEYGEEIEQLGEVLEQLGSGPVLD